MTNAVMSKFNMNGKKKRPFKGTHLYCIIRGKSDKYNTKRSLLLLIGWLVVLGLTAL